MSVIDITTGEPLTAEQIQVREDAQERGGAHRAALADTLILLHQLRSGAEGQYLRGIDHSIQALSHACESNGLDPRGLPMRPFVVHGDAS